eukprot:6175047-Pleurochrysis_carterae.AAC.3
MVKRAKYQDALGRGHVVTSLILEVFGGLAHHAWHLIYTLAGASMSYLLLARPRGCCQVSSWAFPLFMRSIRGFFSLLYTQRLLCRSLFTQIRRSSPLTRLEGV